MFKKDGTPVKNPQAYVEGIKKNGYKQPLFTEKGDEIRDPVAFAQKMIANEVMDVVGASSKSGGSNKRRATSVTAAPSAKRAKTGVPSASGGLVKADGTPIKNPAAFVAGIVKNGYTQPIFGADGKKVRDPVAYVAAMVVRDANGGAPQQDKHYTRTRHQGDAAGDVILYDADGEPIRDPVAYIAGIQKRGYTKPIHTADGEKIRDPASYLAKSLSQSRTASPKPKGPAKASTNKVGSDEKAVLFKADGTPIRNPAAFVEGIKKNGYNDTIFDRSGKEIRNPVAYVAAMR